LVFGIGLVLVSGSGILVSVWFRFRFWIWIWIWIRSVSVSVFVSVLGFDFGLILIQRVWRNYFRSPDSLGSSFEFHSKHWEGLWLFIHILYPIPHSKIYRAYLCSAIASAKIASMNLCLFGFLFVCLFCCAVAND
jgi:hypothetical protein